MRQEALQERWAAEFQPDARLDAQLQRGVEWVNTNLPPMERIELGRYQARKEAFAQQRRTERAAAMRAAKIQTGA